MPEKIVLSLLLTFCYSQKIPAVPSLCCCHWSCPMTHGRGSHSHDSRCHGFHCHAILSHFRWTRYSSSPHPPRGAIETECSYGCCVARQEGPDRCCHCPPTGQADLGCSHPSGAAASSSCTLGPPLGWSCLKWKACRPRLHPGPPAPRSNMAWSLNPLTSGGVPSWAGSRLVLKDEEEQQSPHSNKGDSRGNDRRSGLICGQNKIC